MDYAVHGILQARILEWVAFPLSRGSSHPRDGRTWWVAVYRVAQSRTRLKRLSSSSSSKTKEERLRRVSEGESHSVESNSLRPYGLCSPWNSPGQNNGVGSLSFLQGIFPTQGSNTRSPVLQADSLPAEPQGKPKNIGVGSLSLLQRIFPTQESNPGLLHCRWILYQLSYQESL